MTEQIVITEKSSQAKDVRAAVGSRYGTVLPAEGHLLDLCEPQDANPAWKRWSTDLLKPEGLYGTKPATGGNKAAKLKAIRAALRTAKRVWLATDCDREGQLIGQEILEHCGYRGTVMRVMFTAQDPKTIRDAFGRARPNAEHAPLYAAAVARRQADQIYNLSLTRTATVTLGRGAQGVIGVGRVKTPTLAIACKRELEIRDFVPVDLETAMTLARAYGSADIEAPDSLLSFLLADIQARAQDEGFPGDLDAGLDALQQEAGGDHYALYALLVDMLSAVPAPLRPGLVHHIADRDEAWCGRLALYWLLDTATEMRLAAAGGLREPSGTRTRALSTGAHCSGATCGTGSFLRPARR